MNRRQLSPKTLFYRMPRVIESDESGSVNRDWTRFPMVVHGRVQNGIAVLDEDVRLPEGQAVTVIAHDTMAPAPQMEGSRLHSVLDIATVGLGSVLHPLTSDDDLLGEMLEGRP
jgi:hypothetical protein